MEMIKVEFYRQFNGRSVYGKWDEIDTVSGATTSSSAIARDVFLSAQHLLSGIGSDK